MDYIAAYQNIYPFKEKIQSLGFVNLVELIELLDPNLPYQEQYSESVEKFMKKVSNSRYWTKQEIETKWQLEPDSFQQMAAIFNKMFNDPKFTNYEKYFIGFITENVLVDISESQVTFHIKGVFEKGKNNHSYYFEPFDITPEFYDYFQKFAECYNSEREASRNFDIDIVKNSKSMWSNDVFDSVTKWITYKTLLQFKNEINIFYDKISDNKEIENQDMNENSTQKNINPIKTKLTVDQLALLFDLLFEEIHDDNKYKSRLSKIIANGVLSKEKKWSENNSSQVIYNAFSKEPKDSDLTIVKDIFKELRIKLAEKIKELK